MEAAVTLCTSIRVRSMALHGVGPAVIAGFEQASRRGDIMIRQLGGKVDQKFLTAVLLVKFKEKRTYPLYVELGHTIMIEGKGFQP